MNRKKQNNTNVQINGNNKYLTYFFEILILFLFILSYIVILIMLIKNNQIVKKKMLKKAHKIFIYIFCGVQYILKKKQIFFFCKAAGTEKNYLKKN
ncbi:hypothetical protein CVS40_0166 [Lucilia cuprina]|nr:hypothetical protein CVS40_0166 [Lucilia cuprina]